MPIRLGIFVTHPIQYHVPIWRKLAESPDIQVKVHYFSDHSIRGGVDPGFGVPVAWDTPMLSGYSYEFLRKDADLDRPTRVWMPNATRCIKEGGFDWVLVAGYVFPFELQIIRAAKKLGRKVLMRGEFTDFKRTPPPLWKKLLRQTYLQWIYNQVDAFGCIGVQARRHLRAMGVEESRIFFSPYSVDSALFDQQKQQLQREACRAQLGISPDTFVFLFSGKLIPRKEILTLIRAFSHFSEEQRQKVALLVLGDGEQREQVCREGQKLLGKNFLFQGFVNQTQLGSNFMAADAFVLPSHYEAWGLVVNEAMQFGLPLILSDMIGCHEDFLRPNETGYLFRTGDSEDLARVMVKMMSDPEKSKQMGKSAETLVKQYSTEMSALGIQQAIFENQ